MRRALRSVAWASRGAEGKVRAAVTEARGLLVRGVLDADTCDAIAAAVRADAPTPLLVPDEGSNTVSYATNAWTDALHPPADLWRAGALGQARLDLEPCFPSTLVPASLLGGYKLNRDASCIFVTGAHMRTPLHSDERHGVLLHVAGAKNFVLFDSAHSDADPKVLRRLLALRHETGLHADVYPGDNPALQRVPRFQGALAPGDALFVPQRWLHDIESLTPTVSVSLRFGAWDAPNAPPGKGRGRRRKR